MKYISTICILVLAAIFMVAFKEKHSEMVYSEAVAGEELFTTHCASCHGIEAPESGVRLAPPVSMVKSHYESSYPEKKEFVSKISEWVVAPDVEKSIMPGAVRKFEVMPPLELKKSELKAVGTYMYKTSFGDVVCDDKNCDHQGEGCKHEGEGMACKHKKGGH